MEGYIVHQMRFCVDDLSDKSENYIERGHLDGKRNKRIYSGLTNFQQSQISQLKNDDIMTNPQAKLKFEQIKEERKRNLKR